MGSDPKNALPGLAIVAIVILDGLLREPRRVRIPWATVTRIGNAVAAILLLTVVVQGVGEGLPGRIAQDWTTGRPFQPAPVAASPTDPDGPDVFLIMLDGYLRPDRQLSLFGHDDSAFVTELEARGFHVAARSRSNYLATDASLSTMFNMRHLAEMREPGERDAIRVRRLIEENDVFERFSAHGFKTVSIGSGYEMVTMRGVDQFLDTGQINEMELVAISTTGLRPLVDVLVPDLLASQMRSRVTSVLDATAAVASERSERPRVVFAHVPSPHDPIVFDAGGGPVPALIRPGRTIQADRPSTREEYGHAYGGQVEYLNELTLAAIDKVQAASGGEAMIMVFSDHGSAFALDWNDTANSDLDERTANLVAISTPDGTDPFGDDITLVNTMSRLLSTYFGETIEDQPDEHYRFVGGLFELAPFDVPD